MSLSNHTLLILEATQEYPLSLRDLRERHPQVSFPRQLTEELVKEFGFAVVTPTPRPAGEVVTESLPEYVDGNWVQRWDVRPFSTEELQQQLEHQRQTRVDQVQQVYRQTLEQGAEYALDPDTVFYIQLRDEDRINLMMLRDDARNAGTEEVFSFRPLDNALVSLTPAQTITMVDEALERFKLLKEQVWDLKDQIAQTQSLAELPVIPTTFDL